MLGDAPRKHGTESNSLQQPEKWDDGDVLWHSPLLCVFIPAVNSWPSIPNLPKINLRRQREASWHHLGQVFAADVHPWVGRRAQGQGLAGTWCMSGLTLSLCWFYNLQTLIVAGKA